MSPTLQLLGETSHAKFFTAGSTKHPPECSCLCQHWSAHILYNPTQLDLSIRELMIKDDGGAGATTHLDLSIRELMIKDDGGAGATTHLVQCKLDNLGYIKAHSGLANDDCRLLRLKNAAELAALLADLSAIQAMDDRQK
jgi:hypothetical protein